MSGPFSSAVVSEAVSRATSFLTGKYSKHKNVHEWIERLLRVRMKIESVVKVSEGFDINIKPLHEWQEKFKEDLREAEEALISMQEGGSNRTVEGGSSSPDQSMQEDGSDNANLVHTASYLREAVTCQVDLEANLPHDHFMQEEGSHDATLVQPASILTEAVTRKVDLEANLSHDPFMQEEGSHDAALVHPASNLSEAITRQVDLEANLPHDQSMQEEGSDDATRQVDLEENPSMQEEGPNDATLLHPTSEIREDVTSLSVVNLEVIRSSRLLFMIAVILGFTLLELEPHICRWSICHWSICRPVFGTIEPLCAIARVLKSRKLFLGQYLENYEKVKKLIKTVEKLEKTAGDVGDFIELLKLQSKRNMSRKRKRTGVALFCYGEGPYLLVIMLFRANFNLPTGITC